MRKKTTFRLRSVMGLIFLLAVIPLNALGQSDDLQEFINKEVTTRGQGDNGITIVDLSTFSATKRETTLEISNGKSFRFVNGTLDRDETLNGPIIKISNGSSVEIGEGAIITGNTHIADDEASEIVRMEGGTLNINKGILEGAVGYRHYSSGIFVTGNAEQDPAVRLTSSNDNFYLEEGEMYGCLVCEAAGANVHFDNGQIKGMGLRVVDDGQSARAFERKKATPSGVRAPEIITHSTVFINATTSENFTWGMIEPVIIVTPGEDPPAPADSYKPFNITLYDQSVLKLQKQYMPGFVFKLFDKKEGDIIAEGDGYNITAVDVANMVIEGIYYTVGSPSSEESQAYLELKDNKVYLAYKHGINNVDDLQAKIDEIAANGTSSLQNPETIEIAEEGILIDKYLEIRNNCHVVLTGGNLRISPTINEHSCIYIWSGSSLALNNITVDMMNNDFSTNSYIFNIMGTMKIGLETGGKVSFINVPYEKGTYGDCLFYVYKYANLIWNYGNCYTMSHPQISIIKALSTGVVQINGGEICSHGVPTIDGDGDVSLGSGVISGWSKDQGIIVANSFSVTNSGGCINDWQGESIYIRANKVYFEKNCSFKGKYNKIIANKEAGFLGDLMIPTLYIGKPETFDSFKLYTKLTASNGWEIDAEDWTKMALDKAFIKGAGYQLTQEDFSQMKFLNLPADLEAYLDESDNSVKLHKKTIADDLQDFVNNQTGDFIKVNLSQFTQTTRSKTLEIKTGRKYFFYGGTLKKTADCVEPLMTIGNGSSVEIGTMDGDINKRAWIGESGVVNGIETVRMEGGTLLVTGGVLQGGDMQGYGGSANYDNAVLMTSDDDVFILDCLGAWVSGPIVCNASQASITIKKGSMHTNGADFGTIKTYSNVTMDGDSWVHVELLGKDNVVKLTSALKWVLQITAMEKGYNDAILEGADFQLSSDNNIKNFKYVEFKGNKDYKLRLSGNRVVLGIDDLQDFINDPGNGEGTEEDPIKAEIGCEGIDVNSDLAFKDDLQYFISGQQPEETDCQGAIRQNEGDVTIPTGSTVTYTHLYLYGCGCNKYVYVYGTLVIDYNIYIYNYLRYIYLRPGGRVIIRGLNGEVKEEIFYIEGGSVEYRGGESTGGTYGWYNVGGTFYIYDGTVKGGTCGGWTGVKGTSYIYGGTVEGGIYNYGTTYLYGGTVQGGSTYTIHNYQGGTLYIYGGTCSGNIWSQGKIYLDGGSLVNIKDFYVESGCRIYILNRLTYVLRLNINVENIVLNEAIVLGDGDYKLTEEDFNKITFLNLPSHIEAYYDASDCSIKLREQPVWVNNSDDLQNFINRLGNNKGTEESPVEIPVGSNGLTLNSDVEIDDDLQLFINGGSSNDAKLPVEIGACTFRIHRPGCSFRFKNVDFYSLGIIVGGISNNGKIILSNCMLNDGNYYIENLTGATLVMNENTTIVTTNNIIYNSGSVFVDGTVSIGNMRLLYGGRVYITSAMTKSLHFTITSVSDIGTDVPIILGSNGYILTAEDCNMIDIKLPEGYEWYYDAATASIAISVTNAITGIKNHLPTVKDSYNTTGRKTKGTNKGVTILRMNDGSVRKVTK